MQDSMENPMPGVAQMRVSSHGNLLEVLNELHGKICFVKELTASNVRPLDPEGKFLRGRNFPKLTLPKYFANAHKTKIVPKCIVLQTGMSKKSWSLRLSHCPSRGQSEFSFTTGWKEFVTDNGFFKGDILVFSLTAMSEFQVYMFDSHGLPKTPQMLQASTTEIKVSQRVHKVLKSLGNKREDLTTEQTETFVSKLACVTRSKRKANSDDKIAVLASNAACQNLLIRNTRSSLKVKIVEGSPLETCHDSDLSDLEELVKEEPISDQEELVMPFTGDRETGISDRNLNRSQKSKVHAPLKVESLLQAASFQKRLGKRNLVLIEIPAKFLKKYGNRLQTRVQLQGTLEGSPVRDIGRVSYMSAGQPRFYLRDGWHDFVRENMLRVGQHILFTLTADSFFEVREVIPRIQGRRGLKLV